MSNHLLKIGSSFPFRVKMPSPFVPAYSWAWPRVAYPRALAVLDPRLAPTVLSSVVQFGPARVRMGALKQGKQR